MVRGLLPLATTELDKAINSNKDLVAPPSSYAYLISLAALHRSILVLTASSNGAKDLVKEIQEFHADTLEFPAWETLPHERLSPSSDTVAKRISTLNAITGSAKNWVVVAPIRAAIHKINKQITNIKPILLEIGLEQDLVELQRKLVDFAYQRTDLVEKRGQFAVRGGILDLFPPDREYPVRIDFFGDEIEELSTFAIADQRSLEKISGTIAILPCRELLIDEKIKQKATKLSQKFENEILGKVAEGMQPEGMESLIPLLVDDLQLLSELMPKNTQAIFIERERLIARTADLLSTDDEFRAAAWSNAAVGGQAPVEAGSTFIDWETLEGALDFSKDFKQFGIESDEFLDINAIEPFRGNSDRLLNLLDNAISEKKRIIFSTSSRGTLERYANVFRSSNLPVQLQAPLNAAPTSGAINLTFSNYRYGFAFDNLLFITERDLTGIQSGNDERLPSRRKKTIDPLQLKSGDFVVHEHHGIGKFIELTQRTVGGVTREYLVIEYAAAKRGQPGDRIFVTTDALDLISKYIGGETPAIHRIGSGEWSKAKNRARKAVKEIAAELIRLYAARTSSPGFAFSPDTPWQRELEDSFAFIETADQLSTIEDVKRDMERPYPMDRLICGDVGYGKTEIAVRATFKAVQDGKQVAILVPTTLLVQQHLKTFSDRFAAFPIKVASLSRFNSAKESKEIIENLEKGLIDVVIGTHRLLSKDVNFKDLGLVVVDEEQRFGVEQKEQLKRLRTTVDVLAMSATPIPRTLEMAITGIREMSTITTPPEERHPILTYVGPQDDRQISAAIHRELLRDGQIFYIHNRVESIDRTAIKLKELVPEARIRTAHGQMSESLLEDVILAFWNREFDVLVCTTIVESGLDIPNANTLIVERADNFGLSQLHQIRGRVGRGRDRAYAYFLFPNDKPLTEVAIDRLNTIATNTDLGSGMQVALKDLEIRGAGNLLGGEQSGHIAEVGFDLYMRMVGDAVNDFKKGIVESEEMSHECKIEIPADAHLPDSYIESERLRLDIYRRLAEANGADAIVAIKEELIDRFGELPEPVELLIQVASLRSKARNLGVREVISQGKSMRISPVKLAESRVLKMQRLYPGSLYKGATNVALIALPTEQWSPLGESSKLRDNSIIAWATKMLTELLEDK
ncbi:MAG: transcription-repair coupling factor [Candidatus Nanopelagicaceae bacterium]